MRIIFSLFLFFLFISNISSQRFSAGIVGGLNAAIQTEFGLENYSGINIGILGAAKLKNRFHLSTEIIWSQNGEYILPTQLASLDFDRVRLNFVEIPLQLMYEMKPKAEDKFHSGWLRIGVSYATLIDYSLLVGHVEKNELVVWGKKDAILINFGGVYMFNQHWGVNCRMSISTFGKDMAPTLAFRGVYLF